MTVAVGLLGHCGSGDGPLPPMDTADVGLDSDVVGSFCDVPAALEAFAVGVRPYIATCRPCHDMTVAPALRKAPGPPWFHPTSDETVLNTLIQWELVHPTEPASSLFLLKPLPLRNGGLAHAGGDWIEPQTPAYDGFLNFLDHAAPCAGNVRGR
jgi:hypothetical protein